MTVMVYSIEAWVMSMVGLVWLSVRTIYNNHSFLEEYLLYSQVIMATLNLLAVSLQIDKRDACKSYFIINLIHWILGIYCTLDSLYPLHIHTHNKYNISSTIINKTLVNNTKTTFICCPNSDIIVWNRFVYFAGFQLFVAPMAITQSLQTIHLIIAAGALSNTQHTLWPGVTLGYAFLSMSSFFTTIKFMGYFPGPCPDSTIYIFDDWISIRLETLLWFYVFAFAAAGIIESFITSIAKSRLMWNLLTTGLFVCYIFTVAWNIAPLKMITWPWAVFNSLGALPFVYTYYDILNPTITEVQHTTLKAKNRTRFVVPIQTNLSSLPKIAKND